MKKTSAWEVCQSEEMILSLWATSLIPYKTPSGVTKHTLKSPLKPYRTLHYLALTGLCPNYWNYELLEFFLQLQINMSICYAFSSWDLGVFCANFFSLLREQLCWNHTSVSDNISPGVWDWAAELKCYTYTKLNSGYVFFLVTACTGSFVFNQFLLC